MFYCKSIKSCATRYLKNNTDVYTSSSLPHFALVETESAQTKRLVLTSCSLTFDDSSIAKTFSSFSTILKRLFLLGTKRKWVNATLFQQEQTRNWLCLNHFMLVRKFGNFNQFSLRNIPFPSNCVIRHCGNQIRDSLGKFVFFLSELRGARIRSKFFDSKEFNPTQTDARIRFAYIWSAR